MKIANQNYKNTLRNVMRSIWIILFAGLLTALAAACSSEPSVERAFASNQEDTITIKQVASASVLISDVESDVPIIRFVGISPKSVAADAGEVVELSVRGAAEDGRTIEDAQFVWTMADPRAGIISESGAFRAGTTPGIYENAISVTGIQNTPEGVRFANATATVTVLGEVENLTLTSISILPENPTILANQIFRLRAVGFDQDGRVIPGVSFVWQINDANLGHVNDIGYLTVLGKQGMYEKSVTVTGVWQGARVSKTVNVNVVETPTDDDFMTVQILPQRFQLDANERLQLRAFALNGVGEVVDRAEVRWSIADEAAGTIDPSGGFIAGDIPGVYTEAIKVEAVAPSGQSVIKAVDFASVVVRQEDARPPLESLRVFPDSLTINPGSRALLVAQPIDEIGRPASEVEISWETVNADVGRIDSNGSFTATVNSGFYPDAIRVTASQQLREGAFVVSETVDVTVTGELTKVEIQPELPNVAPGRSIHFSVRGWDENGIEIKGLVALWSVFDDSIGKIDAFGNFTAGKSPGLYEGSIQAEVIQKIPRR